MKSNNQLSTINNSIIDAEKRFNRGPGEVTLIAVSKYKPVDSIFELYQAGQQHFAESYLQEGLDKIKSLSSCQICWHFIGPLQSNKTKSISENFDWVHSIDRYKIAERLNAQRPVGKPPLNVLLQVNLNQESTKSGVSIENIRPICQEIIKLKQLRLRGLMAIPKPLKDFNEQKKNFHIMNELFITLKSEFLLDTLSMGMSNDYIAAISEGATMVRIGTALFGKRSMK